MPKKAENFDVGDIDIIILDYNKFKNVLYTPLSEAIQILNERQKDPILRKNIDKLLNYNIPKIFKENKCAIMSRQIATPNYENRLFLEISKDNNLHPVFLEYFDDIFTSNNKYKHSLGQLQIYNNIDKKGNDCIEKYTIIDFNKSNGKMLKNIKTLWGESLIDFHKKLFDIYKISNFTLYNELDWYKKKKGETPKEFYEKFFLLATCYGILFETFLFLDDDEKVFTKNVVLPALKNTVKLTGLKPLIVPIPPMDLEAEDFWFYQLPIVKSVIK